MALSGSFSKVISSHWRIRATWSGSQSISGNYTDITLRTYWESIDASINSSASKSGNSKIDGTQENFTFTAGLSTGQSKLVNTQTKRVYHSSTGEKSISLSATLGINVTLSGTYYSNVTTSDSVTLNTIPRHSKLTSSPTWTNGKNLPITLSRSDSSFTHDVGVYVGGVQVRRLEKIGTSVTIVWTEAELEDMFTRANGNELTTQINVITYDGNGNSLGGHTEYFGKLEVPTISYIRSIDPFTLGDDLYFTVSYSQSIFNVSVNVYYDDESGNSVYIDSLPDVKYNATWSPSVATLQTIYEAHTTTRKVNMRFRARTYYNGILVSDSWKDTTTTATIAEGKPVFNISAVRHADTNTTTATLTGDNQVMVGGKSQLTVYIDVDPVAQYEANMESLVIQIDGKSITKDMSTGDSAVGSYVIGTLSNTQYQTLTVRAVDSRGLETQINYDLTVYQYFAPTANLFGARRNKFDAVTDLTVNGTFSDLIIGSSPKNAITSIRYRYKPTTTTTWGSWVTMSWTTAGGSFVTSPANVELDNTQSFDLQVQVVDKAGSTIYDDYVVGTGSPILFVDADKNSVGVGKFPTGIGTLETKGDIDSGGAVKLGSTTKGTIRWDGSKMYIESPDGKHFYVKPNGTIVDIGTNVAQIDLMGKLRMYSGDLDMNNNDINNATLVESDTVHVNTRLSATRHKFDNGFNWLSVRDSSGVVDPAGMYLIQNKLVEVQISATTSGFVDVSFPDPFDATPLWVVATPANAQSFSYSVGVYNISSSGCRIYAQNVNGVATTLSLDVQVVACGQKS